jgi:hypothetical protein
LRPGEAGGLLFDFNIINLNQRLVKNSNIKKKSQILQRPNTFLSLPLKLRDMNQ